jgi:hypothetical protein
MLLLQSLAVAAAYHVPQRASPLLPSRPLLSRAPSPLLVESDTEKPRSGGFPLPFFQQEVPEDQQASAELNALKRQFAGDWPADDGYNGKLFTLYAGLMLFISLPIAYTTFYVLPDEIPQLFIASNFGTFAAMLAFVLKIRYDWGTVSGRLNSRTTYFEADQTGQRAQKDKGVRAHRGFEPEPHTEEHKSMRSLPRPCRGTFGGPYAFFLLTRLHACVRVRLCFAAVCIFGRASADAHARPPRQQPGGASGPWTHRPLPPCPDGLPRARVHLG